MTNLSHRCVKARVHTSETINYHFTWFNKFNNWSQGNLALRLDNVFGELYSLGILTVKCTKIH